MPTKGVSVAAVRRLIDNVCGDYNLPLFVLHDFDAAGFVILGTLQRNTRRYQFSSEVEGVDLGLRLADIDGLEREPAAATRTSADILRDQLAENGADDAEIDILLNERVELNAMASGAPIEMIESKLEDYGLEKTIPDDDLLADAYRGFHRSQQLRRKFEEMRAEFDRQASEVEIPEDLQERVRVILEDHSDLRWDDAIQIVLDETQLDHVRAEKLKAKKEIGRLRGCRRRPSRERVRERRLIRATINELAARHAFQKNFADLTPLERMVVADGDGLVRVCTFHPNWGYEDFIGDFGLRLSMAKWFSNRATASSSAFASMSPGSRTGAR